jgi:cytochrome c oxidase subunit I+III
VSVLLFLINVARSRRRGLIAGPDPWGGPTLEWATSSPPAPYNFARPPVVTGRDAWWARTEETPEVVGLSTEKRETLSTTVLDAEPEHRHELPEDSLWPALLALVTWGSILAVIFHPIAFPIGLALAYPILFAWFWRNNDLKRFQAATRRGPSTRP